MWHALKYFLMKISDPNDPWKVEADILRNAQGQASSFTMQNPTRFQSAGTKSKRDLGTIFGLNPKENCLNTGRKGKVYTFLRI